MRNYFFVAFLVLTLEIYLSKGFWIDPGYGKTYVVVWNELEGGQELKLHCKSGDDDLGLRVLKPDNGFKWTFRPNFWHTTQFYCTMQWGDGKIHRFDIYIWKRDYERCGHCQWIVKESGPCFFDLAAHAYDICYGWKP
ncbi:unnamed protein product [Linum tenue]|uniref:S-protein homolog n=1 Tax=Linum tenue TaxID=586396 RepID=A0AAV0MI62_9ROSI|nr:unnamed protein product [Linum tenue]